MNYKTRQPFPHAAYVEGQRNFTYFDRSLTAGLTDVVIESPGDFLYIDQASTGVVSVELNMRQGGTLAPILLAAGGSIECDFASIKLNATAQLGKTVRVIIGNGAKIKGGATVNPSSETIQTTDGGRFITDANKSHLGWIFCSAGGASFSHVQLFNPANSGKTIYVDAVNISTTATGALFLARYSTALGSLASPIPNPRPKRLGGNVSVSELRYELAASQLSLYVQFFAYCTANQPVNIPITTPLAIPSGDGLCVIGNAVNQQVSACFSTWEE